MDKTRVFISSTCYDLSQVRRDLEAFLQGVGYEPVLSDSPTLAIPTGLDTVEACKWLVHASDIFVLIIGGRYGNADAITGKSITNIEYETALAAGMPIYAFVDREVWLKRDTYSRLLEMVEDGSLSEEKILQALGAKIEDPRVFGFLSQVSRAQRDSWIREFSSAQEIIEFLKLNWSLLLKELLSNRRNSKRSFFAESSQPDLKVGWQSSDGGVLDVHMVAPAPAVDVAAVLARVDRLRPSEEELATIAANRDEVEQKLRSRRPKSSDEAYDSERALVAFDSFLLNLAEIERVGREEPTKFRWRYNLLARCIKPALVVSNSGACPADEIVLYLQPSNPRTLFGDIASWAEMDLSLPEQRPTHVQDVLDAAKALSEPPLSSHEQRLASLLASMSPATPSWPAMSLPEFPVAPRRSEVAFAVEDGALRVDIAGRLKHHFVQRVVAEYPLLYCFLNPGEEAEIAYQIHADNLTLPSRGTLCIRAGNEASGNPSIQASAPE